MSSHADTSQYRHVFGGLGVSLDLSSVGAAVVCKDE